MEHGGERSSDDEPIDYDPFEYDDSDSYDEIDGDDEGVVVAEMTKETLVRLKQDDPRLITFSVETATWIKGAGLAIGRNTMLKHLEIILNRDDSLAELWSGLVHNKTIEWFSLHIEQVGVDDVFPMIEPFFRNNFNLRHILIGICWTDRADDEEFALLFNALQRKTSLLCLVFSRNHLDQWDALHWLTC